MQNASRPERADSYQGPTGSLSFPIYPLEVACAQLNIDTRLVSDELILMVSLLVLNELAFRVLKEGANEQQAITRTTKRNWVVVNFIYKFLFLN